MKRSAHPKIYSVRKVSYTVGAEVFVKTWSESLGRAIEIFECPLCHDYDFVARGETLYRHGCGALLVLYRHPRKDILVLP